MYLYLYLDLYLDLYLAASTSLIFYLNISFTPYSIKEYSLDLPQPQQADN